MIKKLKWWLIGFKVRKWKSVFGIRNPWIKKNFEQIADKYSIKYVNFYSEQNGRTFYIIVGADSKKWFKKFLVAFLKVNEGKIAYFKNKMFGTTVYNYTDI